LIAQASARSSTGSSPIQSDITEAPNVSLVQITKIATSILLFPVQILEN